MTRTIQTITLVLIGGLLLTHDFPQHVFATVCSGTEDCQNKIKEYEGKLNQARDQKNTLSSQINLINTRVDLAKARLEKTETEVETTRSEVDDLTSKIERLNIALDRVSSVLLEKIVEGYKNRHIGFLDLFFSPKATTLENQLKYIRTAQENDRVLAIKTEQIKINFSEQKDMRERKITELENLEKQLVAQRIDLNNQAEQKTALLDQTKNDEKKFQQLLNQALSEFQAINQAVQSGQKVGPVKKGDAIALIGNSGYPNCSTGKHLHLEVRKDGTWVNPGDYLGKDWQWPISEPITITQGFGVTPYSWRYAYSGGIHTGYDMISGGSDVIRAVADGTLYSSNQSCSGSIINIRYIDHGGGLMSFYLHVQ